MSKVNWFENLHVAYKWSATQPLSIQYTLLASGMSRMIEYIAIEDDNVMTHFLQVLTIGIKAPLPNSVMVWLLKLSHLMPGDHFLSGKFE